ncbi:hypothetical protein [Streptomyces sp. NPDC002265]|uniref:hypothetical protein n=1 Tax=Streptomyces sp. NPDC002265 TaxID=3154415 RepID=UPI003323056D
MSVGTMYAAEGQEQSLMAMLDDDGLAAGPTFEYIAPRGPRLEHTVGAPAPSGVRILAPYEDDGTRDEQRDDHAGSRPRAWPATAIPPEPARTHL